MIYDHMLYLYWVILFKTFTIPYHKAFIFQNQKFTIMIKKTVLLFVAACSLLHAFAQTTPISNAELEARGT